MLTDDDVKVLITTGHAGSPDYWPKFLAWLEEHDRQVAERAWDEAAEIDADCHDCIDLNGYTNPYRDANPH